MKTKYDYYLGQAVKIRPLLMDELGRVEVSYPGADPGRFVGHYPTWQESIEEGMKLIKAGLEAARMEKEREQRFKQAA